MTGEAPKCRKSSNERRSDHLTGGAKSTPYFSQLISPTTDRVQRHTDEDLNGRTTRQTETNVASFAADPRLIDRRLEELDREWRWYFLPTAVATFLLQHAVQGWCPPVGLFRRLGVRTEREIDEERYALKLMRSDFGGVDQQPRKPVDAVLEAIRR
jgi:hypothetical protein